MGKNASSGSSWFPERPSVNIPTSNIDWTNGYTHTKDINTNTTFTFSNNYDGQTIVLRLKNTSASTVNLTWPANTIDVFSAIPAGASVIIEVRQIGSNVHLTSTSPSAPTILTGNNIDWAVNVLFERTITTNSTMTFSNDASGKVIVLRLINGTGSALSVSWPASVVGLTSFTLGASKTSIITFTKFGTVSYALSAEF